ncbi:MAG: P1 family peptidase [Devosia nanyangense]|nr:P1 family peptidase [Devosia nanyangense]
MTMLKTPKPRARELGLPFPGTPGPFNAITDVPGIAVGFRTLIEEQPRHGRSMPVRTGVTAIIPHAGEDEPVPVYAGLHRFNGNGEMTGTHWIEDGGYFLGPLLITNTHAVGMAHHGAVKWMLKRYEKTYTRGDHLWIMPVVAETYDGALNDINGLPIGEADVLAALDGARSGPVAEGSVGGGTGMIAYGFKAGTGTASRKISIAGKDFTVGVLVQANHGQRPWLTICGVPVGQHMQDGITPIHETERGSIIVAIATDIPLMPHQLKRLARRGTIGIARNGTIGGNNSGDIFLAFSTANRNPMAHRAPEVLHMDMLNDEHIDVVYAAVVEAVEEAVVNAMVAAEGAGGGAFDRYKVEAIDTATLCEIMARYGRLERATR